MKCIVRYFFILILLVSSVNPAMAGYWVKTAAAASAPTATAPALTQHAKAEILRPAYKMIAPKYYQRSYRQSEWVAIASLVCGLVGLLVPGVNFLAILFGVLGMGRGSRVKGLAIAGFILGVLELILFIAIKATFLSLILL